jgi:hypothetical protein
MSTAILSRNATVDATSLDAIFRRISEAFKQSSWPGLRRLNVEFTEIASGQPAIRISGTVGTLFEKQQAYHRAKRFAGDELLEVEIQVVSRKYVSQRRLLGART